MIAVYTTENFFRCFILCR